MAEPSPAAMPSGGGSFYCSTSGTTFDDKEAYLEHMKSDFHRYNLKRKVAGLPPVTKEWFESRKELLIASTASAAKPTGTQVWLDPLTKKKFLNENTYLSYTRSKKYQELVRKSGQPAPAPLKITKEAQQQQQQQPGADAGPTSSSASTFSSAFQSKNPGSTATSKAKGAVARVEEEDEEEDGSGWETASDVDEAELQEATVSGATAGDVAANSSGAGEAAAARSKEEQEEAASEAAPPAGEWEDWDVCRSLFDNHASPSMDLNLEYMYKNFGFYLPDAEFLVDPAGLIKYLGAKLQYGRVPLYTRGDDANARQFRSLHAVQRHMVDTNQCRLAYDDNEDEYAQYYDYGPEEEEEAEGRELAVAPASAVAIGGFELMIPGENGQPGKVLGTREFARYYRQSHRLEDSRQSVQVNTVLARYRSLGIALTDGSKTLAARKRTQKNATDLRWEGKREVRRLVFSNFVKQLGKGVGREY